MDLAAFCREIIEREVPLSWTCLSRVDRLTPEFINFMKQAGCVRVFLGLESGSDETLRLMNKRVTVKQGMRAVNLFSKAGIGTAGFFMVGYPGETREAIEKTFSLVLALPLDEAWFRLDLSLFPGHHSSTVLTILATWDDWEVSNQVKFVYQSEFDERWLEQRIKETLEAFREQKSVASGKERSGEVTTPHGC